MAARRRSEHFAALHARINEVLDLDPDRPLVTDAVGRRTSHSDGSNTRSWRAPVVRAGRPLGRQLGLDRRLGVQQLRLLCAEPASSPR